MLHIISVYNNSLSSSLNILGFFLSIFFRFYCIKFLNDENPLNCSWNTSDSVISTRPGNKELSLKDESLGLALRPASGLKLKRTLENGTVVI